MNAAERILKMKAFNAAAVFFLACAAGIFALEPPMVAPSVPEGTYGSSVMISFRHPEGTRLSASLDGGDRFEPVQPVILSASAGEDRIFTVDTELRSLTPDSPVVARQRFSWRVDRKAPPAPVFSEIAAEGGRMVTLSLSEDGTLFYQLYHQYSETRAESSVKPGTAVFLPDDAVLCAFAQDAAGNSGPSASVSRAVRETDATPFRIVNPVPGNWANPQVLLVDAPVGTGVFYSLDGSDPAASGLAYVGPVLLDVRGSITLRVWAEDTAGKTASSRLAYTVASAEKPAGLDLPPDGALVETGEFGEITIPAGLQWSLGDPVPSFGGGHGILFSSVRGTRSYYPLTVSDGTSLWRWICASGSLPAAASQPELYPAVTEKSVTDAAPAVRIHDWHFIAVDYGFPVYCSTDGTNWNRYTGPVFVARKTAQNFIWYSPEWKGGDRQTVRLPPKPRLAGLPAGGLTANPVFISAEPGDYAFNYEAGHAYYPSAPGLSSPILASGLLAEVPSGATTSFTLRLLASIDGLVHGELDARFVVDRKPPRIPSTGIPSELKYSRTPVSFTPSGEERVVLSIQPERFNTDGKTWVLPGDPAKAVEYTVSVHALDAAGNASAAETRKVTVDLNALYVDSSRAGSTRGNGSPEFPFAGLDEALSVIRGTGVWRVYVKGPTVLSRPYSLQARISLIGENAVIVPEQGAVLTVNGGSLSLSGLSIRQNLGEPGPGVLLADSAKQAKPLFEIRNASFNASGIDIMRSGLASLTLLRATGSSLSLSDSRFDLSSAEYALLFDITDSTLVMGGCDLQVTARNASALSLASTSADIASSTVTVSARTAGRAIEGWNSRLTLNSLNLVRMSTETPNRDTAIWLDRKSAPVAGKGVTSEGFWRYSAVGGN